MKKCCFIVAFAILLSVIAPSIPAYAASEPINVMLGADCIRTVNVNTDRYSASSYGGVSDPSKMTDERYGVGPTNKDEGFNSSTIDKWRFYDADGNEDLYNGEYLWSVTFDLNGKYTIDTLSLMTMDLTPFIGDTDPVQWLQRGFDILVSDTGLAGSWKIAHRAEDLHTEDDPGEYTYHAPTDDFPMGYYQYDATFDAVEARYIQFGCTDYTSYTMEQSHWINISELEIYTVADATPDLPSQELNAMRGAFYIGQFNLNEEFYSDSALGGISDPTKLQDGLYGKGPTNKDTGLNTKVVDKTATYNADGKPAEDGEYLWGITYRLNREYELTSFALMIDDLTKFGVGITDTIPWMQMGFDLLVSETGEDGSWQVVHQARDLHTETSAGKYTYVPALMGHHMGYYYYTSTFTPTKANYVRFASTSLTCPNFDKSHWINIAELLVYGEMEQKDPTPVPKEEGNVMRDSTFVKSYNIREDIYAPSVYGGTCSPLKMIDGRYGMGPTQMDDSFHGLLDISYLVTDLNHGVESFASNYHWYTMFELDKEYTLDRFSLMVDDLTTCGIGGVNPVQYLPKNFDILVSDTGEEGSWRVAYTARNTHTCTDKKLYNYFSPSEERPLGYYQIDGSFAPIKAKYICLGGTDWPYQNANGEYWVEVAELQVYETDKEPPAPTQTVLPEGENMMLRAEYLSAINLDSEKYTNNGDGTWSNPAKLIDGKWASNPTYTMEGLNTRILDASVSYNANGIQSNSGAYKWMATYKLDQRHFLNGFRLITHDLTPFARGTNPVQWLQRDFDILISDTGEEGSWQVLYSAENLHTEDDPGAYVYHPVSVEKTGYYELTVTFPESAGAWFVRFASRSLTSDVIDSAHWVNIAELEIYGEVDEEAGALPGIGKMEWNLSDDGTLTITGNGLMQNWNLGEAPWILQANKILRVVIGEGVTSIGSYAFDNCRNITSVSLPTTLTQINHNAFSYCSSLASVEIPEGVKSIGDKTFQYCYALASLQIPTSVVSIGDNAFVQCSSLTSVIIPNGVVSIGAEAFSSCTNLASVTMSDTVTTLGDRVFYGCNKLENITLSKNLKTIPSGAFRYDAALTEIEIPAGVTEIGTYAFASCYGLKSIRIPDSVTVMGASAFATCSALADATLSKNLTVIPAELFSDTALTEIEIPESVTEIGQKAFYYCQNLTEIVIPDSVNTIGNGAFRGCSALATATLPKNLTAIPAELFSGTALTEIAIPETVTEIGEGAFDSCKKLEHVALPQGLTKISDNLFSDCSALTEITIPAGVTEIGKRAFSSCRVLTDISFPDSVKIIGDYAFSGCTGFNTVILNEGVSQVGDHAFGQCSSVKTVYVPASVVSLHKDAFYRMTSLEMITVASDNSAYMADAKGVLFTKDLTTLMVYPAGRTDAEYTVPYGVETIGKSAFYCSSLTRLVLPRTVKTVEHYVFVDCNRLTDVVVLSRDVAWYSGPPSSTTMHGYENSTAQAYATTYNRPFQLIQEGGAFGQVTTLNPNGKTTVRLMQGDTVISTYTMEAESGSGSLTQYFHLYGAPTQPDVLYDVVIEKEGHLPYTITGISLESGEIDLTAHADPAISQPVLQAGDIDGNGFIDLADVVLLTSESTYGRSYEDARTKSADVNGDGIFDLQDLAIVTSESGYGRSAILVDFH